MEGVLAGTGAAHALSSSSRESELHVSPSAGVRVLVVDDDPGVRDVLSALLTEEGYALRVAEGAEAALLSFAEFSPELVLCDMKMPGRDGLWLLDEVQRHHPNV